LKATMNREPPDLIPVRALNQVTYCPRLYYLEYVESVMPVNEHVEDGLFQHRRVDDPDLANRTRKEGDSLRTRGVLLSSQRLGITGKLDLLEERPGSVRPVDTKRSSAPTDDFGDLTYWENDAVQLCAQALLVEESLGVSVPSGFVYYAGSKARVEVPFDDPLRARTRAAIALARDLSTRDVPPEPLPAELRHRCFGCSLAPICLPEETLYLIHQPPPDPCASARRALTDSESASSGSGPDTEPGLPKSAAVALTRVIPNNDDKAVLYLQEAGSHVGRRSSHLVVTLHGQQVGRVPIASIRQVVVFGNVQVSTQALHTLADAEVPLAYLSAYGRFIAALVPSPPKNVALRAGQFRVFSDPARALTLARAVVAAKIANQRTLLMRSLRSRPRAASDGDGDGAGAGERGDANQAQGEPGPGAESEPARISGEPAPREMAALLARVPDAADFGSLLGLEGQSAAVYFANFGRMLKSRGPGAAFDFTTRNRRPPRDPVNSLLSFAYALLVKDCFSAACTVGFDPYQGFYHVGRHGRPSLALDLMEEFRPVIADSVVLSLINNGMVVESDFLTWRGSCLLTDDGRAAFFKAYEQRKSTEVTHPVFGYKMSYGRMLEVQARMLAAYVRGDIPAYTGFTVR
ncbi:MAG: CRISPR-associated endonuclease Cas1, partial [Isosphaeraceae bacterium]